MIDTFTTDDLVTGSWHEAECWAYLATRRDRGS